MPIKTFTLAEQPDREQDFDDLAEVSWPRFMRQRDALELGARWPGLFTEWADYQLIVMEGLQTLAVGHTIPISWDGTEADLLRSIQNDRVAFIRAERRDDLVNAIDDRLQELLVQLRDGALRTPVLLNERVIVGDLFLEHLILLVSLRLAQHRALRVELALQIVDFGFLLFGGLGELLDFPVERLLRFPSAGILREDLLDGALASGQDMGDDARVPVGGIR